jgi:RNA polymerase sigma-70 factor (ECF subfamily)
VDDGTEFSLVQRALDGDQAAFAALLEPVLQEALRLAYGMLLRYCDAEDCVQEAARRSWQRLGNLKAGQPFRWWFRGIVRNRCREVLRGRWWSVTWLSDDPPSSESDWAADMDLRRALAALPHKLREVIVLRFYVGLSEKEIAATLGLSLAGVGSRMNRALKRLRQALGEG